MKLIYEYKMKLIYIYIHIYIYIYIYINYENNRILTIRSQANNDILVLVVWGIVFEPHAVVF